jgi:hypothetical protein
MQTVTYVAYGHHDHLNWLQSNGVQARFGTDGPDLNVSNGHSPIELLADPSRKITPQQLNQIKQILGPIWMIDRSTTPPRYVQI